EVEIFLHAAIAERAVAAGLVRRAAIFVGLLGRKIADVGFAFFDERDGVFENLIEIVAGVKRFELRTRRRRSAGSRGHRGEMVVRLSIDALKNRRRAFGFETEAMV